MKRLAAISALSLATAIACGASADEGDGWTDSYTPNEDTPDTTDTDEATDTADPTGCEDSGDSGEAEPECEPTTGASTAVFQPQDSNGYSSPRQVAASIWGDSSVPLSNTSVRTHEFLNDATFDYTAPSAGGLGVDLQLAADASTPDQFRFQVGLRAEERLLADIDPMVLTLVVDTSCSMSADGLARVRDIADVLDGQLRDGDIVNLVAWDTQASVLLEGHAAEAGGDALRTTSNGLSASGATGLEDGLIAAYDLAEQQYRAGYLNRVLLISDGFANVGNTAVPAIAHRAGSEFGEGIWTVAIAVGDWIHDGMMDQIANAGQGASLYLGNRSDVQTMLGERLPAVLDVAARDIEVRIAVPEGMHMARNRLWQPSPPPADKAPQHLGPGEELVLHRTLVVDCPEGIDPETPITVEVSWTEAGTFRERTQSITMTWGELEGGSTRQLTKAAAVVAFSEVLKLAKAGHDQQAALTVAYQALEDADPDWPGDPELTMIRASLERMRTL